MKDDRKLINLQELKDQLTINGVPVYARIEVDPETGDLLDYEYTPEMQAAIEAKAAEIEATQLEILNGTGPSAARAKEALQIAQDMAAEVKASIMEITAPLRNEDTRRRIRAVIDLLDELQLLDPYLRAELSKEEYNGMALDDLLNKSTPGELLQLLEDQDSYFYKAMQAARASWAAEHAGEVNQLPQIRYNKGDHLQASTDKLTNVFFSLAAPKSKHAGNGQREMIPLKYEHGDNSKEITLFYDYAFNDDIMKKLGLSLSFDSYDFFVAAVCDNLLLQGNKVVSLTKIWHEMNEGNPNSKHLNELYESLVKGATTTLYMDDREVREAWGLDTGPTYEEIISAVMPLQIKGEKFKANGNVANAQIVINGLSPFFALSQSIGHYSTWKKEVLTMYPGKRTKRYYSVLHYLMITIGWIRNPASNRTNKITYKALYSYVGDKTTRAKQLTRDMAYRLLDEVFKPAGYVISYKEDSKGEPGIIVKCTKNTAALLNGKK